MPRRLTFAVVLALAATLLPTSAFADAPPLRLVDVVQVTWPGAASAKVTAQQVADVVRDDTIARWRTISNGRVQFTLGQVLPAVRANTALPCDAAPTVQYMDGVASVAYERAGITDRSHRYVIVVSANPPGGCVWDGRGIIGVAGSTSGSLVLRDTADPMVIAHELGHNLGLGHSNLERCSASTRDGAWSACTAVEYGSATDVMSNTVRTSALAAYHQWRMGWIRDADVAIGNRNETVTLHPVDALAPWETATETATISADTATVLAAPAFTRALFVRDKTAAYWVEFRRTDTANGIAQGLVVYRTDPPPAASVDSPIASDKADPTSSAITTDIWMVNLGDWSYPASVGSPSLPVGVSFTTAFGGASIAARVNAAGDAEVTVTREGSTAPAAPTLTDVTSWRNADAPITTPDLDDNGAAIANFEAELGGDSATTIVRVPRTDGEPEARTYLNPLAVPAVARVGGLPEGRYTLRLRAVNTLGVAGEWSSMVRVQIDRGTPEVSDAFAVTSVVPGASVALAWTGARDAGAGVCSAQVLNDDGWATLGWAAPVGPVDAAPTNTTGGGTVSAALRPGLASAADVTSGGGVPRFTLPAAAAVAGDAQVFDCVGNGVAGSLDISAAWTPAKSVTRTGKWAAASVARASAALAVTPVAADEGVPSGASTKPLDAPAAAMPAMQCKVGVVCTARITTDAGTSLIMMGAGSASLTVDGVKQRNIASVGGAKAVRVVYVAQGAHRIVLQGKGFVLVGVQHVATAWAQTSVLAGNARALDASLGDATQSAFARMGFAQADFSDSQTVRPMGNGTTLLDPTLDFCSADYTSDKQRIARRQVVVSHVPGDTDPYLFLSTETVRYQGASGVTLAKQELDTADALCRSRGYALRASGAKEPYVYREVPASWLPGGMRPADDRRVYWVQMGDSATAVTFLIVYQFEGSMLNAMYVSKVGAFTLDEADVRRWLGVAGVLGARLHTAVTLGALGALKGTA